MNANDPEKDKMNDLKWLLQERLKAEEIERERKKAHGERNIERDKDRQRVKDTAGFRNERERERKEGEIERKRAR